MSRNWPIVVALLAVCSWFGCDSKDEQEASSQPAELVDAAPAPEPSTAGDSPAESNDARGASALPLTEPETEPDSSDIEPAIEPAQKRGDAGRAEDKEDDEDKKKMSRDACRDFSAEINASIEALPTSCREDSDCQKVSFGCPFGCADFFSKSAKVGPVRERIVEFAEACPRCLYRCRPTGVPVCKDGTCAGGGRRKKAVDESGIIDLY
jgi:hypothetical protein